MHKYLQSCLNLAHTHEYDSTLSYKHAALIVRGGAILSVGYNSLAKNSFVDDLVRRCGVREGHTPGTHAEVDAILAVRNKIDLTGAKLYVARYRAGFNVGMSKPCHLCQNVLQRYGIKKAVYTIDNKTFGVLRV